MNYALTELKEQHPILRKYHSKMLQMISTKVAGALTGLEELRKREEDIIQVMEKNCNCSNRENVTHLYTIRQDIE